MAVAALNAAISADTPGTVSAETGAVGRELLEQLLTEHTASMYRLARSIVRDAALSEDVVQESLLKAWQAAESFRGDASLRSWVLRITHNTAISTLRKRREELRGPSDMPEGPPGVNTDRAVDGRLAVNELWAALDDLDPTSRSIVILREIEDFSYEEICETLELTLPVVKTRLFRARRSLAKSLEAWQ